MKIRILCAIALGLVLVIGNKASSPNVPGIQAERSSEISGDNHQHSITDLHIKQAELTEKNQDNH